MKVKIHQPGPGPWEGCQMVPVLPGCLASPMTPRGFPGRHPRLEGAGILLMYFFLGGWHNLKTSLVMDLCTMYGGGAMCHVYDASPLHGPGGQGKWESGWFQRFVIFKHEKNGSDSIWRTLFFSNGGFCLLHIWWVKMASCREFPSTLLDFKNAWTM